MLALSARWLWVQLAGGALLLAFLGTDLALVETHVSCAVYHRTTEGLPAQLLACAGVLLGAGAFLVRVSAQIIARQGKRALGISLAIAALELALLAGAFAFVIDKTLFYCAFEGVKLNACELGFCVH